MDWWSIPGPRRFVERVEAHLAERIVVLVGLPAHGPANFALEIESRISVEGDMMFLSADETAPLEHVCRHLGLRDERPSLSTIAAADELHGRVIVITDISDANWPAWCDFFLEFAQFTRNQPFMERAAILCILTGDLASTVPRPAPGLAVCAWDDVSSLDMLVYATNILGGRRDRRSSVQASIVAGLAQYDPSVVDALADTTLDRSMRPEVLLDGIARGRQWEAEPPTWANGAVMLLDGTPVYHLAHPFGRSRLRHVLWHSHVVSLFAILEERRFSIIDRYKDLLLEGVPPDAGDRFAALEYGDILTRLRACRDEGRLSYDEANILGDIDRLRRIRNCLAHARPLSIDQLTDPLLYEDDPYAQFGAVRP